MLVPLFEKNKKRGLVIVYDPHNLQQFIWYYCTYGKEIVWDALCLPNSGKGTYMTSYCEKAGIFSKIMTEDTEPLTMPFKKKIKYFIQMFLYYIVGKRKQCCKKILNEYVEKVENYDVLATICDSGFVSGLLALLGEEKEVIYFDDGAGDYCPRHRWKSPTLKFSFSYVQGLLLARMGYSCHGRFYFEPTKYCYKYSAVTDKMQYRNYKKMYDLDISKTDLLMYNTILNTVYPEIRKIDFSSIDVVFFPDSTCVFTNNYLKYDNACSCYIGERYKSVLLKRHPRDFSSIEFGEDVKVQEVDSRIPAELLFSFLGGKKIFFSYVSSIIIFMNPYNYQYSILYLNDLYEENSSDESANVKYFSKKEFREYCDKFSEGNYEIIEI